MPSFNTREMVPMANATRTKSKQGRVCGAAVPMSQSQ